MDATLGSAARRRTRFVAPLITLLLLSSCAAPGLETSRSAPREDPEFAIVFGDDGVAMTDGHWIEQLQLDSSEGIPPGPEAVGLDASRAAVVAADRIAVVSPDEPAVVAECADCAGIAATDEFVVTTRKNFVPGEGFDILLFSQDLGPVRTIPTQRLEERVTTSYPAENTASPITLAADDERVTVGYLSRVGGVRRGPSVVAQYDYEGQLLSSVLVDGIIGRSAVSPDGRHLAIGVGGSGGACITVSEPVVVDLQSLRVQIIEPTVPADIVVNSASLSQPWFMLTDLVWRESTLVATGEVHNPAPGEFCDSEPDVWQRIFEPASGRLVDFGDLAARAIRWVGPECEHVLAVTAPWEAAALVRTTDGPEQRLGSFDRISLGRPMPQECREVP